MKATSSIIVMLLSCLQILAQNQPITIDSKEYQHHKLNGTLHQVQLLPSSKHTLQPPTIKSMERTGGACNCLIDVDTNFVLAMAPNDDGSTANIPIPFNFCLYGSNYNSLWINNNGNVTFDNSYPTFSAVGFPDASYVMIAPFWGDVDTRGIGTVHYQITPTYMIIKWDSVGYFNTYTDKTNTFQLIISDGIDPIIPNGGNVSFCYGDMQWTTGDASSGVGGFGGVPATVGANKGNGIEYFQVGRFNVNDTTFDGSYGLDDGISFLDDKYIVVSVCDTNVPPIGLGDPCDTIQLMVGETIETKAYFLSPETSQLTTVNASVTPGLSIISSTPANSVVVDYQFIGTLANVGFNTVTFTATDDAMSAGITTYTRVYEVIDNTGIENEDANVTIYPNPTNGTLYIQPKNNYSGAVQVRITTATGQVVHMNKTEDYSSSQPLVVDLSEQVDGLYFISVSFDEKNSVFKMVKGN